MAYSVKKSIKRAQLLFKRRKRWALDHGDQAMAKKEERRIAKT